MKTFLYQLMSFDAFLFFYLQRHFFYFLLLYFQVTVVTSQPGQGIVRKLEMGLKDADLVSLKRLLVVQIYSTGDWSQETPSPEATHTETEGRRDIDSITN